MFTLSNLNSMSTKDITNDSNSLDSYNPVRFIYVGSGNGTHDYNETDGIFEESETGDYNILVYTSDYSKQPAYFNNTYMNNISCKIRTLGLVVENFGNMANQNHFIIRHRPFNNTFNFYKYELNSNVEHPECVTFRQYNDANEIALERVDGTRNYIVTRLPEGARLSTDNSISLSWENDAEIYDFTFNVTKLNKGGV